MKNFVPLIQQNPFKKTLDEVLAPVFDKKDPIDEKLESEQDKELGANLREFEKALEKNEKENINQLDEHLKYISAGGVALIVQIFQSRFFLRMEIFEKDLLIVSFYFLSVSLICMIASYILLSGRNQRHAILLREFKKFNPEIERFGAYVAEAGAQEEFENIINKKTDVFSSTKVQTHYEYVKKAWSYISKNGRIANFLEETVIIINLTTYISFILGMTLLLASGVAVASKI